MSLIDNTFYINTASISVLTASGSLYGSASWANNTISSSYAFSASWAPSTIVTTVPSSSWASSSIYSISSSWASASISSSYAFSASWAPPILTVSSASWASASISSSYSATASYFKMFPNIKAGKISSSVFAGMPLTYSITFTTPYPSNAYAVSVIGGDARSWTAEQVSASNFTISTNSTQPLTDYVYWTSIYTGESV